MEPTHKGRAIVLPAKFEGSNEMSHCTIKFLGTAETMEGCQDQVMQALYNLTCAFGRSPRIFWPTGTDWFGVDRDVPVMRLTDGWLGQLHKLSNRLLDDEGVVPQPSTWEYQPHVTLADDDMPLPEKITLYPPVLWWEDERPVSVPWMHNV